LAGGAEANAPAFMELLTQLHAITKGVTPLTVDIPMGMGPAPLGGWMYQGRSMMESVLDIVDRIALMSYRNHAAAPDGIIDHASDFLAYANQIGKTIVTGVETGCDGLPTKVTFCGETETDLETQLNSAYSSLTTKYPNAFGGLAVHDDQWYQVLAAKSGVAHTHSRSMWVWSHSYVNDLAQQGIFLDFCVNHKVNRLFQESEGLVGTPQLTAFINNCWAQGIKVELLFGDAEWALTPNHGIPIGLAKQAVAYIETLSANNKDIDMENLEKPSDGAKDKTSTKVIALITGTLGGAFVVFAVAAVLAVYMYKRNGKTSSSSAEEPEVVDLPTFIDSSDAPELSLEATQSSEDPPSNV